MPPCHHPSQSVLATCYTQIPLTLEHYSVPCSRRKVHPTTVRDEDNWYLVVPIVMQPKTMICSLYFNITPFHDKSDIPNEFERSLPLAGDSEPILRSVLHPTFLPKEFERFRDKYAYFSGRSVEASGGRAVRTLPDGDFDVAINMMHEDDGLPILLGVRLRDLLVQHHLWHLALQGDSYDQMQRTVQDERTKSPVRAFRKTLDHCFLQIYLDHHTPETITDLVELRIFRECCLYGLKVGYLTPKALMAAFDDAIFPRCALSSVQKVAESVIAETWGKVP